MSLNLKYENVNKNTDNVVPLGNAEMQSILKAQSESVFIEEKKMISNNSGFIKKSLIDLAIEFENKEIERSLKVNNIDAKKTDIIETSSEIKKENNSNALENVEIDKVPIEDNLLDEKVVEDQALEKDIDNDANAEADTPLVSNEIDPNNIALDQDLEQSKIKNADNVDTSSDQSLPQIGETQQALESVRNAVSKSINNSIKENESSLDIVNQKQNDDLKDINQDMDNFKNIFSTLSNLTEKVIHENIENKIIEIAAELAGFQIDKMPDKYEKKIKTFLKSINRFQEKMSIEINDQDYEALLKIENFNSINETIKFIPNSDISRGDITLNCDGMYYSEKTIKKIEKSSVN